MIGGPVVTGVVNTKSDGWTHGPANISARLKRLCNVPASCIGWNGRSPSVSRKLAMSGLKNVHPVSLKLKLLTGERTFRPIFLWATRKPPRASPNPETSDVDFA